MSIADKLLQVNQVKQDIKTAIETKGIPMTNVAFTEYANKILDISGGGGIIYDEYFYYSIAYYIKTNKSTLFANAWEHSLTVDPLEISEESSSSNQRGRAQYPNGATEGVIIPNSVTSIGNYAFWYWTSNNQPLVIPNSVMSIGDYAFRNWSANNQPLMIPNSVTSIGNYAFNSWTSNNQPLVIPNSVTSIGSNAFRYWELVPYIEIQATTPPTLAHSNAFNNQNNAPIYVPDESVDDYKIATNWVTIADRIFPRSDKEEPIVIEITQAQYDALSVYDNNTYYLIVEV